MGVDLSTNMISIAKERAAEDGESKACELVDPHHRTESEPVFVLSLICALHHFLPANIHSFILYT